jgi:hypothetical protein
MASRCGVKLMGDRSEGCIADDSFLGCVEQRQQVIIQIWISSHFGLLSKRLRAGALGLPFTWLVLTPVTDGSKGDYFGRASSGLLEDILREGAWCGYERA